jgi:CBS domain-containing protein
MSTNLTTVSPSTTVAEAATLMASRHIGSALVCDGDELAGIFTERDIVKALSQDFDAPSHPIEHWMTRSPETVGPDADVRDCLDIMVQRGFRHLPITEGSRVVGIVSIRDLSKALSSGSG